MQNQQYRVLFLEDEPTIREVLKEYMSISNYHVTEIDNGDDAIALLNKNSYDIAVLDIMVPGASGLDVLSYIKDNYQQTATIMLTALEDEKTQVDAFNRYADDYVVKPVSPILRIPRCRRWRIRQGQRGLRMRSHRSRFLRAAPHVRDRCGRVSRRA
jgi:DNA-binding response OmpR family regulator